MIKFNSRSLDSIQDIDILLEHIGDSQFVLLGEASHGTSEFYRWRSEISKRLIKEKGFNFIAVEGDWPDCYRVNKFIKGYSGFGHDASTLLRSFNRWPTWMWANKEMVELVQWLRKFNDGLKVKDDKSTNRVGFYGLDLYSLWESMEEIITFLKKIDPPALKYALEAYNCFEPYNRKAEEYARSVAFVPQNCKEEVIEMLSLIQKRKIISDKDIQGGEDYFNAEQNALVAKDAENYYRIMIRGDVESWNVRDRHMMDTLERLVNFHNQSDADKKAKAIVWAHNTHIGDARFTDMKQSGMINLGQLTRERKGSSNTVLIGFSTYTGTVVAAEEWGKKIQIMKVPPAIKGSWDELLHELNDNEDYLSKQSKDKIILFDKDPDIKESESMTNGYDVLLDEKYEIRGQRAIGVVYRPKYEKYGNYVPTVLSKRYDAIIFIDNTNYLNPLHVNLEPDQDLPETFPRGE